MPFLTNDSDVDTIMSHLQTSGLKILRVWGFNDVKQVPADGSVYFQLFSGTTATINTGPNGLQRLDAVVNAAEKYDVKLIINFVNNWKDCELFPSQDTSNGRNSLLCDGLEHIRTNIADSLLHLRWWNGGLLLSVWRV